MEEAKKIAGTLLNKKLIACANFLLIESSYLWEGKVENSKEVVALLKTKEENWEKVKEKVNKLHSYNAPCIIKLDVEGNKEYVDWVGKETNQKAPNKKTRSGPKHH